MAAGEIDETMVALNSLAVAEGPATLGPARVTNQNANRAVDLEHRLPQDVAAEWLRDEGMI